MKLSKAILQELARLGGSTLIGELADIRWPAGNFSLSLERVRACFPEWADLSEYALQDVVHTVRDLAFVSEDSGFWPSWKDEFPGTDPARFLPFSSDEAYFYFIDMSDDCENPSVYYVDHETTGEEPYHPPSYRLETFLSVLERDDVSD